MVSEFDAGVDVENGLVNGGVDRKLGLPQASYGHHVSLATCCSSFIARTSTTVS